MRDVYDAVIVGGGPAGLSAALILGRCRRSVLVCDDRKYRNADSGGLHGYLTRDCIPPAQFLQLARKELEPYSIEFCHQVVTDAVSEPPGFKVTLDDGRTLAAHKLLVATGVVDRVPDIPGMREFLGRSVFHCPYCDGWEMRDQPLAVYGQGAGGYALSLSMLTWSGDVILFTDGPARLIGAQRKKLDAARIAIHEKRIRGLEGEDGALHRVVFQDGESVSRRGLFFSTGQDQRCDLASRLGCEFTKKGSVRTARKEKTRIAGLYVAGDASHDVQFVIVAAAEGAKAAVAINAELQRRDRGGPGT